MCSFIGARQHVLSALYAIARPSVCLSITRKRLKLGSCNFHHTVAPSLSCLQYKFHPEIPTGSPEWGRQTRVGWGNELILSVFERFRQVRLLESLLINPNSQLIARWRLCRVLTPASARLSCFCELRPYK